MSDEPKAWERQPNEPLTWHKRFTRFRLMEPVRSIAAVFQEEEAERNREKPRTKPTGDWYEIAKEWSWEERVAAWDEFLEEQTEKQLIAERKKVLKSGFAVMHKRVKELDAITTRLIGYLDDENNVWLPDVKAIGTGPHARQVDIVHFNSALFGEIRNYLGDIAAEMGERVKKNETAITSLPANVYIGFNPDEEEGNQE